MLNSSKAEHGDLLMSWEEEASTDSDALSSWMRGQVCQKLVGVTSKTHRAQVTTTAVRSGTVVKGQIHANLLDVVLELEGQHFKEQVAIKGSVRCVGTAWVLASTKGCDSPLEVPLLTARTAHAGWCSRLRTNWTLFRLLTPSGMSTPAWRAPW